MKTINLGLIDLDIHEGKLGVSVSGGADSALLLYHVMKHATTPIHVLSCANRAKHNLNPRYAFNVIEKCIQLTGNTNVRQHVYFVEKQTRESWGRGLYWFLNNKIVDIVYTGVTANPPNEVLEAFTPCGAPGTHQYRNPNEIRSPYQTEKFYTPFTNLTKKKLCELYEQEGLLEELYPITRSCEDFDLKEGHCGTCWWCQERKWGFGRL